MALFCTFSSASMSPFFNSYMVPKLKMVGNMEIWWMDMDNSYRCQNEIK